MKRWLFSLVGPCLGLAISLTILDVTLFRADYILGVARRTGSFDVIAEQIALNIQKQNQDPASQQIQAKLITPDYVGAQLESLLRGFENYLRDKGPLPTLDTSDLKQRAQQLGVVLPPEVATKLDQPVAIPKDQIPLGGLRPLRYVTPVKIGAAALALLLLVLMVATAKGAQRLVMPAKTLMVSAIWMGIGFGLLRTLPSLTGPALIKKPGTAEASLGEGIQKLVTAVITDVSNRYIIAAAGLLLLAAGLFGISLVIRHRGGGIKPLKVSRSPRSLS